MAASCQAPATAAPGYGKYGRALSVQYMLGVTGPAGPLDEEKSSNFAILKLLYNKRTFLSDTASY